MTAVCALLVPLFASILWTASLTRQERAGELAEYAAAMATAAAADLDQSLRGLDALASALVRHPAVIALDPQGSDPLFAELVSEQPLLTNVLLVARDGSIRAAASPLPAAVDWSQPWVDGVVRAGRPVIDDRTERKPDGPPEIVLAYPVSRAGGGVAGVVGLTVDLTELRSVFGGLSMPGGSVVTLTDGEGRVLARTGDGDASSGSTIAASAFDAAGRRATSVSSTAGGTDLIYASQSMERGPWVMSVGIPTTVLAARLWPQRRRNLTIVASTAVVLMLLNAVFARQTARHLSRLKEAAQRIADGDLSPPRRLPVPNRELAQLQDAFILMAASLRETRDALDRQMEQERKMNEAVRSLQRQVVRQERLAAVGVLVSGVAHELNNPLQSILGTAELLERGQAVGPEALEELAFLKTQSGRACEIIRNLSRFTQHQPGPPSQVDLRDVVAEVVQLRRRDLAGCAITLDVEPLSARTVQADFTELEQVTLNFVLNAQQAIEAAQQSHGRILIRLQDVGGNVRLEVHDNGPGVTPENEPKLFQPFFTTKPVGKGTGLGLSVSYGIIESHGGRIGHSSNEWGGATFFFELRARGGERPPVPRSGELPVSFSV